MITHFEFENVSAKTFGSASYGDGLVLVVRWKKRTCVPIPVQSGN
jgi:hypothetical protein